MKAWSDEECDELCDRFDTDIGPKHRDMIRAAVDEARREEREVEAKERQRARLDEALSVVTAHRDRLEREVASYEGMDRAVTHYQEEVRRLEQPCVQCRAHGRKCER